MRINKVKSTVLLFIAVIFALVLPLHAGEWTTIQFAGKVTDAQGKPLSGVEVLMNRTSNAEIGRAGMSGREIMKYMESLKTQTTADGSYTLPLQLQPNTNTMECELWLTKKDFVRVTRVVDIQPDNLTLPAQDVTLQPGLVLSGKVEGNSQAPLFLLKVTGRNFDDYYVTDEKGRFEFYAPPGQYRIEAPGEGLELNGIQAGTTNLVLKPVWSQESVGKAFDDFWNAMDQRYSYFFLKTNVDWKAMRKVYRPKALQATNAQQLGETLQTMLNPLQDIHTGVETPQGEVRGFVSRYSYNGNRDVTFGELDDVKRIDNFAIAAKTKRDGFGYFLMVNQGSANEDNVQRVIEAIRALHNTPGFVVDLRLANGGSEPLAAKIAALFCAKDTVYAKSKFRDGPGHNDFTKDFERVLPGSPDAYTNPVVCLMGGGAVSSGEGFVQMMKCLPQATTVGLPTRGASGNPQSLTLKGTAVHVYFSSWVDMMPDGTVLEDKGVMPEITVDVPWSAYEKADPTLEKGLEILRQKVATRKKTNP